MLYVSDRYAAIVLKIGIVVLFINQAVGRM